MDIAYLDERLRELHGRTTETPLFNPVFQLAHDLSRQLEAGELSLNDIENVIADLEVAALGERASRLSRMVQPLDDSSNEAALAESLGAGDFLSLIHI